MSIKALIAVRSGSVRVENKNIRPFAGSNLLQLKIEQFQQISQLDGIVVNSNDDQMLSIAQKMGCETVKRDQKYASNEVSMSDVYKNMAQNFSADIVFYANVTNPLVYTETYSKAIKSYSQLSDKYDSLNSAHLIKEFLFHNNLPINYDLRNQPRSQDLPDICALNFAINILSRDQMIEGKNVVGFNPSIFLIDRVEATDIDDPIDFQFSEFVYQNRK